MHRTSRILAIESDPERAGNLSELLREYVDAEVVMATSAERAVAVLAEQPPDLILTSTLLPRGDAVQLTTHLKRMPAAGVPILTVPPVMGPSTPTPTGGLLSFFGRRGQHLRSDASRAALGARISEAFEQAKLTRRHPAALDELGLEAFDPESSNESNVRVRRARRLSAREIYWLTGVKLPSGLEVELVNISRTGLLLESGSDLMPGSTTTLTLFGPRRDLTVPARIVRSELAGLGEGHARYQTAATFQAELELDAPPIIVRTLPASLDELRVQVSEDAERGAGPGELRELFERGLMHLVPAREIRIRTEPAAQNDGSESIYFTVPTGFVPQPILQVTFEPNHMPSREDFDTLEAAVQLAAQVAIAR